MSEHSDGGNAKSDVTRESGATEVALSGPGHAASSTGADYEIVLADVAGLLESAHREAARSVNATMTATYWQIGRRLVEIEQAGRTQAMYGEQIVERLSHDLTERFGRGFGQRNLFQMPAFYLSYADADCSGKVQALSAQSGRVEQFLLPRSHYVRLLAAEKPKARAVLRDRGVCTCIRTTRANTGLVKARTRQLT